MPKLTIHNAHRTAGRWHHEVPEDVFERQSIEGVDFAVTGRNYYLEQRTGKIRWTDEGEYIKEVYVLREDQAVHAFSLPSNTTLESRLAIPLQSDGRSLLDHVRDMLVPGGPFEAVMAAAVPLREAEPPTPGM